MQATELKATRKAVEALNGIEQLATRLAAKHGCRVWLYQEFDKPIDYILESSEGFDALRRCDLLAVADPYEDEPFYVEYMQAASVLLHTAKQFGVEGF